MDELAKRFFHDPAVYARAVELLSRYEAVENLNWESVEDYLAGDADQGFALGWHRRVALSASVTPGTVYLGGFSSGDFFTQRH
jgi:hypothetical protein